ncbi:hypothetical protein [Amycolatopsis sp. cmx-4-68]|uniref:hypothetical protein n=1 Tax=Amycolatopsis sp. cmx-4-68 TaxID=2790938 RepID=UPI00397C0645
MSAPVAGRRRAGRVRVPRRRPRANPLPSVVLALFVLFFVLPVLWLVPALATLPAITPVLVVFLVSQRFLVTGMLAGATAH